MSVSTSDGARSAGGTHSENHSQLFADLERFSTESATGAPGAPLWPVCLSSFFFWPLKMRVVTSRMGMLSITATLAAEQRWKREAAGACSEHRCLSFVLLADRYRKRRTTVSINSRLARTVICDARWTKIQSNNSAYSYIRRVY